MGFATVPRLERNRFHALLFLDIPFCLWVVSGLFGGFDDGLACLDDFVAGLKKPDTYKEWTGSFGLATDLFDVCTELPEDLDRNLIGRTTELLDIGTEPVESVGIGLFGLGSLLMYFVSESQGSGVVGVHSETIYNTI